MSAAVNRPHDVLSSRPHLPLTGELHPLRREFERLLATGNVIALTFAMLAFTVVNFWPREAKVMDGYTDMDTAPFEPGVYRVVPNEPTGSPNYSVNPDIPEHFIPDPVPHVEPRDIEPEPGPPGDPGPFDGRFGEEQTGAPPPIDVPAPATSPDYVYYDSEPVLLSCVPPVYPDIVRDAGIDGSVPVRVLVGIDGKVKKAYVVDGPQVLREAALESARTALFKPALAKGHPVEVWVYIPVVFKLHATD